MLLSVMEWKNGVRNRSCVCVRVRVCEWGEETFRQGTFRYDFRFDNVERRNIGAIS